MTYQQTHIRVIATSSELKSENIAKCLIVHGLIIKYLVLVNWATGL